MTKKRAFLLFTLLFMGVNIFVFSVAQVWPKSWQSFSFLDSFRRETTALSEHTDIIRVQRVIDGDTIELANGDRVRYIGMDTPESVDSRKPVECFGKEAAAFNRELVEGKAVRLERDISDRDKYGRLLRYVYVGDELVNATLVKEGYAHAASFPPDVAKQDLFQSLEREARDGGKGLWASGVCE